MCGTRRCDCSGEIKKNSEKRLPFSPLEKMEMILLRFLSSGTDGRGLELWLAESVWSLPLLLKLVLLILTGGAGGLSSWSPLSHMTTESKWAKRKSTRETEEMRQGEERKIEEWEMCRGKRDAVAVVGEKVKRAEEVFKVQDGEWHCRQTEIHPEV